MKLKFLFLLLTVINLLAAEALSVYARNLWLEYHSPDLSYSERWFKKEDFINHQLKLSTISTVLYSSFLVLVFITILFFIFT